MFLSFALVLNVHPSFLVKPVTVSIRQHLPRSAGWRCILSVTNCPETTEEIQMSKKWCRDEEGD